MKTLRARINLSVQRLGFGMESRGIWVRILSVCWDFSRRQITQPWWGAQTLSLKQVLSSLPGGNTSTGLSLNTYLQPAPKLRTSGGIYSLLHLHGIKRSQNKPDYFLHSRAVSNIIVNQYTKEHHNDNIT